MSVERDGETVEGVQPVTTTPVVAAYPNSPTVTGEEVLPVDHTLPVCPNATSSARSLLPVAPLHRPASIATAAVERIPATGADTSCVR